MASLPPSRTALVPEGKAESGKQANGQSRVGRFRDNGKIAFHEDRHRTPFKKDAGIIGEAEDARWVRGCVAKKPVLDTSLDGVKGEIADTFHLAVTRIGIEEEGGGKGVATGAQINPQGTVIKAIILIMEDEGSRIEGVAGSHFKTEGNVGTASGTRKHPSRIPVARIVETGKSRIRVQIRTSGQLNSRDIGITALPGKGAGACFPIKGKGDNTAQMGSAAERKKGEEKK